MSKIRIHELAKELHIDSKELVNRLKDFNFRVKSHMSSLSEEEAEQARELIRGEKTQIVEETRVKSTVIRRRTKLVDAPHHEPPKEEKPEEKIEDKKEEKIEIEKEHKISEQKEIKKETEKAPQTEVPEAPILIEAKEKPKEEPPVQKIQEQESEEKEREKIEPKIEPQEEKPKDIEITITGKESIKEEKPKEKEIIIEKDKQEEEPRKITIEEPPTEETKEARDLARPIKPSGPGTTEEKLKQPQEKEKRSIKVRPKIKQKPKKKKEKKLQIVPEKIPSKPDKKKEGAKKRPERTKKPLHKKKEAKPQKVIKIDEKRRAKKESTTPKPIKRRIKLGDSIIVSDLAKRMGIKASDVLKKLLEMGLMVNINQPIDAEDAAIIASEFGYEIEKIDPEEELLPKREEDKPEDLLPRPPVVTIMGHVDHGKTSLLDAIRESNLAKKEAGGITQHIGAYHVKLPQGNITFLDTPGHEAFTAMRARGAQVTDIVVLVVAADDGVMQQTKEAIDHARAGNVPIIVAVNKIDKPNADPDRVKRELAELGLVPEEWGGETIFAHVSALKKIGIDELLELILLQAEILELKANPNRPAFGYIIEAKLDTRRGPVATVLVQGGTLRVGDPFICGSTHGKVRAMLDDTGNNVKEAGPSIPVEIQGIAEVPMAGDEFLVVDNEKQARQISEIRKQKKKQLAMAAGGRVSLNDLYEKIKDGEIKELNLILKADVQGSLEAIKEALSKLEISEVKLNIIHTGVGGIRESDVMLAVASKAIIIGFNIRPSQTIRKLAEQEQIEIRFYDVIYDLISDVKQSMVGLLSPKQEEVIIGHAEVRQVFSVPKVGNVAGCYVQEGLIKRGTPARLLRDDVVVYTGRISSLRRFKDDVKEVKEGYECGVGLENFQDIKPGDMIECYEIKEIAPKI